MSLMSRGVGSEADLDAVVPSRIPSDSPLHEPWELTVRERQRYREIAKRSRERALLAARGELDALHEINAPSLDPRVLMPHRDRNGLSSLSLFSGGGGLDLAFDRAGYTHVASYEILSNASDTLRRNRPNWTIYGGDEGNVTNVDWTIWRDKVDVLHGGPPCQPFSHAGRQRGHLDPRDCWPHMVKAIKGVRPRAFVAENVVALDSRKFEDYVREMIVEPLEKARPRWYVKRLLLRAWEFGVPQVRRRLVFVGFQDRSAMERFIPPAATHWSPRSGGEQPQGLSRTMGVREALGLEGDSEYPDCLAPTIRSGLGGPRNTTSVCNSMSAARTWASVGIWPNGVAANREAASRFPVESGAFRLSIADVALIQGFPPDWTWPSTVYQALGQIGNAVPPPLGWAVATAVGSALHE
jgi:DNA (cytosine-5)-methyltransferase 1